VRTLFVMCDNGASILAITRWLQTNEIKTRLGKTLWYTNQVKNLLECRTYAGNRYYRATNISDVVVPKHKRVSGTEQPELIRVKVPAIISQELFDRVQGSSRMVLGSTRKASAHQ
jgi:hypothetical protein